MKSSNFNSTITLAFLVVLSAVKSCLIHDTGCDLQNHHESQPLFVMKNHEFSSKIFNVMMREKDWRTMVTSPLAVELPLGQLLLGACGVTAAEIAKTLCISNCVASNLFPCILKKLDRIQGLELGIVSKIYAISGLPIKYSYQQQCLDLFNSQVETFDPRQPLRSLRIMNEWVETHTNNRIRNFVKPSDFFNDTKLFLVNAAYFNGMWSVSFDRRATKYRKFYLNDVRTQRISTMFIIGSYLYTESPACDAKILRMEFKNCVCSMLVFLPNSKTGVPSLVMKMQDIKFFNQILAGMQRSIVQVYMPKFKIISEYDLTHILPKIGISKIFDSAKSNLSNMIENVTRVFVGKARHKAFFQVTEEGAEAETGNEFETMIALANRSDVKLFKANRPFVFQIRIEELILFQGSFMG